MSEWKPIETAPKDGTRVLLGRADEGWTTVGSFDDERDEWWESNTNWDDFNGAPIYPTHWQPLPEPPQ